jgi:hypothetical protein
MRTLASWTPEQWQTFLPALGSFLGNVTQAVFIPLVAAVLGHQYGVTKANQQRLDRHGSELDALKNNPTTVTTTTQSNPPVTSKVTTGTPNPALVDTLPLDGQPLPKPAK